MRYFLIFLIITVFFSAATYALPVSCGTTPITCQNSEPLASYNNSYYKVTLSVNDCLESQINREEPGCYNEGTSNCIHTYRCGATGGAHIQDYGDPVLCGTTRPSGDGVTLSGNQKVNSSANINWQYVSSFSADDTCEWTCDTGYIRDGDTCVEPESCNGIDDDGDGLIDEDFECIKNSVDCDATCNLDSGGCTVGNLKFVQTDWSGGRGQFTFGDYDKYQKDNGFVSVTGTDVGKIVFDPTPVGDTVGGYDSGWIPLLKSTAGCSFDMVANGDCWNYNCAKEMVNAVPGQSFNTCTNAIGAAYSMLYQSPGNPLFAFAVNIGRYVSKSSSSLTINRNSPEGVNKNYYFMVDASISGSAAGSDSYEITVNGISKNAFNPNHVTQGDIWWGCYFQKRFPFNSGNNTIKFKATDGSVHFDGYRITEEKPIGLPLCITSDGSTTIVGGEGELMFSVMELGTRDNWGFVEWDFTKNSGEAVNLQFQTSNQSDMSGGVWHNISGGNGLYDLTAYAAPYTRFGVGVDGGTLASPVFNELRLCSRTIDVCAEERSSPCTEADLIAKDCYSCEDNEYFDVNNMRYCFNYDTSISDGTAGTSEASRLTDPQQAYCLSQSFPDFTANGLAEFNDVLNTDERLEHILSVKNAYAPNRVPFYEVTPPKGLKILSNCNSITNAFPANTHSYLYADGSELGSVNCSFDGLVFATGNPAHGDENGRLNDGWGDQRGAVCQFERTTPVNCNYCTGDIDPNSVICNGSDTTLNSNTQRTLSTSCTSTKCEYVCGPGYTFDNGACVSTSTPCYDPSDPVFSLEETLGLDVEGLVSYWPMDIETSGETSDIISGNDGIIDGADLNSEGIFSSGYNFVGTERDRINVGDHDNLSQGPDGLSGFAWIKTTGGHYLNGTVISKYYGGGQCGDGGDLCSNGTYLPSQYCEQEYKFTINTAGLISTWFASRFSSNFNNTGNIQLVFFDNSYNLNDGNWHQVGFFFDSGNLKYYVDGVLVRHLTGIFGTCQNSGSFIIGDDQHGNLSYFNGLIDDVVIFNRELSDCEIKVLAKGPTACFEGCVGICGSKNKNYLASETDWPSASTYCEYGIQSTSPSFPEFGQSKNWDCESNGISVGCIASRNSNYICLGTLPLNSSFITDDNTGLITDVWIDLVEADDSQIKCEIMCDSGYYRENQSCMPGSEYSGVCGDRNRVFDFSEIDWQVGSEYCSTGINNLSPSFPDQGDIVTWKCLGSSRDRDVVCSATRSFDTGICGGNAPVGDGIIVGPDNYTDLAYLIKDWGYSPLATTDTNCLWKCEAGYTRVGYGCQQEGNIISDVNNLEYLKLGISDRNILVEIQCSNNLSGLGFSVVDESGKDINKDILFYTLNGSSVTNGNLDCNNTPTKYILKSNLTGLDTYPGDQKYLVTGSIKEPCNICSRSGYIFYEKESRAAIPDANLLVAMLVAGFAIFIVQRKRI